MARRTIHLVPFGTSSASSSLRCVACGQLAPTGETAPAGGAAVCSDHRSWVTTYADNPEFRRCTDPLDERDRPALARFPTPTEPGFYWAEWRIAEDGTWPLDDRGVELEHVVSSRPEVVRVVVDLNAEDWKLVAEVAGFEKEQELDNFVWRSARLREPGEES